MQFFDYQRIIEDDDIYIVLVGQKSLILRDLCERVIDL